MPLLFSSFVEPSAAGRMTETLRQGNRAGREWKARSEADKRRVSQGKAREERGSREFLLFPFPTFEKRKLKREKLKSKGIQRQRNGRQKKTVLSLRARELSKVNVIVPFLPVSIPSLSKVRAMEGKQRTILQGQEVNRKGWNANTQGWHEEDKQREATGGNVRGNVPDPPLHSLPFPLRSFYFQLDCFVSLSF